MTKGHIAVIGSLNVDFVTRTPRVPAGGETLRVSSFDTGFGGKGANQAVACARVSRNKNEAPTDIKVSMVGSVGDDSFGADFIAALKKDHIDTSHVKVIPGGKTGVANIVVEEGSGENRILFFPGANYASGEEVEDLVPDDADVVVFQMEIPLQQVLHNIRLAREKGKYVILNTAPATPLPEDIYKCIDCLITNESEADILRGSTTPLRLEDCPRMCRQFLERGVRNMYIVTLGAQGAYFAQRQDITNPFIVPSKKAKVVDTTAAGDTFVGALAVKIAENGGRALFTRDVERAISFANTAAARSVEKAGAMAAIPYLDEII